MLRLLPVSDTREIPITLAGFHYWFKRNEKWLLMLPIGGLQETTPKIP